MNLLEFDHHHQGTDCHLYLDSPEFGWADVSEGKQLQDALLQRAEFRGVKGANEKDCDARIEATWIQ